MVEQGAAGGAEGADDVDAAQLIDTEITRAVGVELKAARLAVGMSREDLASQLRSPVHARTIASYEQGSRHCTVPQFVDICQVIGRDPAELLERILMRADLGLAPQLRSPVRCPACGGRCPNCGGTVDPTYLALGTITSVIEH